MAGESATKFHRKSMVLDCLGVENMNLSGRNDSLGVGDSYLAKMQ